MTTPLEQLRDELIGWFDVEFEPDAIDLVRRFYDYAASEHERAERLAVQLEQMDNELLAEIAAKNEARQVAAQLLRVARAYQFLLSAEDAGDEAIAHRKIRLAKRALSPALRKMVER